MFVYKQDDSGMFSDFEKNEKEYPIWRIRRIDRIGQFLFSFDKKVVYNFWSDYPDKLTKEQIKIFDEAYPVMAALKK